jgi:cellulose synthase/poly-beta-1,6-N-acetylglucosamine synthase-like glycosyltransferase
VSLLAVLGLALAALSALLWIGVAALVVRARATVPSLSATQAPPPARWPTVSLIVPARDEAAGLEAALRSKLALDYPGLEVVLVDDRSTDATGAIADRLAAEQPHLSVVHVRELPKGWLGKVHALTKGVERSTGEWLLFTDADIHYDPQTLRRAIALCEAKGFDYLAALPRFESSTFAVNVAMAGFVPVVMSAVQADWIEDPKSAASIGAGVFALVRASAYRRSPGLEHLKLEIADDVGLGQLMKRSGARCGVVAAPDELSLTMYPDFAGVVRGTAKAACAAGSIGSRCSSRCRSPGSC